MFLAWWKSGKPVFISHVSAAFNLQSFRGKSQHSPRISYNTAIHGSPWHVAIHLRLGSASDETMMSLFFVLMDVFSCIVDEDIMTYYFKWQ